MEVVCNKIVVRRPREISRPALVLPDGDATLRYE
jgi:hypothetical protein